MFSKIIYIPILLLLFAIPLSASTYPNLTVSATLTKNFSIPPGATDILNFSNSNTYVGYKSLTPQQLQIQATVKNVTATTFPNTGLLSYSSKVLVLSIEGSTNFSALVYSAYPCQLQSNVAAFKFNTKNLTWVMIANATVNATTCKILFNVPSDPIVGLFTTSSYTAPTTNNPTTIQTTAPPGGKNLTTLPTLAIVVIIIIAGILYYLKARVAVKKV